MPPDGFFWRNAGASKSVDADVSQRRRRRMQRTDSPEQRKGDIRGFQLLVGLLLAALLAACGTKVTPTLPDTTGSGGATPLAGTE
jgi:hypothetical protein